MLFSPGQLSDSQGKKQKVERKTYISDYAPENTEFILTSALRAIL